MPHYTVRTLATIERHYEVEADNVKAAVEASTLITWTNEEEIYEEVTGVFDDDGQKHISKAKFNKMKAPAESE